MQAMWWVAQAMWWEGCAGYVVGGLRRLCGGSDSDNRASFSSTITELANWN